MGVARGEFSKARPGTKFATELSQYNELMYQLAAVNTNIELETGDWRVDIIKENILILSQFGYYCTFVYFILYTTTAVCLLTRACT